MDPLRVTVRVTERGEWDASVGYGELRAEVGDGSLAPLEFVSVVMRVSDRAVFDAYAPGANLVVAIQPAAP